MFSIYPDNFSKTLAYANGILDAKKDAWGIVAYQAKVGSGNGRKSYGSIVYFVEAKFRELLEKGKFENVDVVLKELKSEGYLDCEKDRYYRHRKVTLSGSRTKVYGIKIVVDTNAKSVLDLSNELALQKQEFEKAMKRLEDEQEEKEADYAAAQSPVSSVVKKK